MCGITGWLLQPGTELPPAVLDGLSESIRHRGPDDTGEYRDPAAGLALAPQDALLLCMALNHDVKKNKKMPKHMP